jgi:hypothetical protein
MRQTDDPAQDPLDNTVSLSEIEITMNVERN